MTEKTAGFRSSWAIRSSTSVTVFSSEELDNTRKEAGAPALPAGRPPGSPPAASSGLRSTPTLSGPIHRNPSAASRRSSIESTPGEYSPNCRGSLLHSSPRNHCGGRASEQRNARGGGSQWNSRTSATCTDAQRNGRTAAATARLPDDLSTTVGRTRSAGTISTTRCGGPARASSPSASARATRPTSSVTPTTAGSLTDLAAGEHRFVCGRHLPLAARQGRPAHRQPLRRRPGLCRGRGSRSPEADGDPRRDPGYPKGRSLQGHAPADDWVITYDEFLELGNDVSDEALEARINDVEADDVATIVYTSGTTGVPKGAVLTHDNLTFTAQSVYHSVESGDGDVTLLFLPLAHVFARTCVFTALVMGATTVFARGHRHHRRGLQDRPPALVPERAQGV